MNKKSDFLSSSSKLFKKGDVFVYSFLAIAFLLLFLFLIIIPTKISSKGFSISVDGNSVANYYYENQSLEILDSSYSQLISYDTKGNTITVYTDSTKEHYNVISIDNANKTARVSDANCSISKDCVYTPSIKNNSAIVCAPHKLKIVSLGKEVQTPPTTGGVR